MDEGDAWFRLRDWHGDRCAICHQRKRRYNGVIDLVIDHCHRCLAVRGLICTACNSMGDEKPVFRAYSLNCPTWQLGIKLTRPIYGPPRSLAGLPCGHCKDVPQPTRRSS